MSLVSDDSNQAPRASPGSDGAPRAELAAPADAPRDVVLVGPERDGGARPVLRLREGAVELGELRAAQEGKPIHGELVRLSPRDEHPQLFDVEVVVPRPREAGARKGPAKVASDDFRSGWERTFSKKRELPS
jgi:hypothetical protein